MGRVAQFIDFLTRNPNNFKDFSIKVHYTHLEITPRMREMRRKFKFWKKK